MISIWSSDLLLSSSSSSSSLSYHFQNLLMTTSSAAVARAESMSAQDETLQHLNIKLDARQFKKSQFASHLLDILRKLRLRGWCSAQLSPEDLVISKVSGALTNAVFFVSCKTETNKTFCHAPETVLLRIYGPGSDSLISRARELRTLHLISTRYNIGPRIYGTFENGRIEEYFESTPLSATDLCDPKISEWIAARMAELHSVDITDIDKITQLQGSSTSHGLYTHTKEFEITTIVKAWLESAKKVLALPGVSQDLRHEFDLPKFGREWEKYVTWVLARPETFGTRRVFAHNDTQYGNILRLKDGSGGDEHRQIIVVDFEYAAGNPAAYDIANHFYEWTADYHGPTPHILSPSKYPTELQRFDFYGSYIRHAAVLAEDPQFNYECGDKITRNLMEELDRDVEAWGAGSHAVWAIWGIVQAKEYIEMKKEDEPEFDYFGYARGRMSTFRRKLMKLGIDM